MADRITRYIAVTVIALVSFGAWLHLPADEPCESSTTMRLRELSQKLGAIPVEDLDPVVPVEARSLLSKFKAQLVQCVTEIVNDPSVGSPQQATKVTMDIIKRLTTNTVQPESNPYGRATVAFDCETPEKNMLVVKTIVSVNCGADTSLYFFHRTDKCWRMFLKEESQQYEMVDMAREDIKYMVTPSGTDGTFVIVTAWYPSWCTSAWRSLHYSIYEAHVDSSDPPKQLVKNTDSLYIGIDQEPFVNIVGNRKLVSLSYYSYNKAFDGTGDPMKKKSVAYAIEKGKATITKNRT